MTNNQLTNWRILASKRRSQRTENPKSGTATRNFFWGQAKTHGRASQQAL